jgi:hypothetical protein
MSDDRPGMHSDVGLPRQSTSPLQIAIPARLRRSRTMTRHPLPRGVMISALSILPQLTLFPTQAIQIREDDRFRDPGTPLIWDPDHVTTRFAAQRSRFMIFGSDGDWLTRLSTKPSSKLRAITMKYKVIPEIKRELRGPVSGSPCMATV